MDINNIINAANSAIADSKQQSKPTVMQIMKDAVTSPNDKSYISFDGDKIVQALENILYYSNREIVGQILSKQLGFPQADGTHALYANAVTGLTKSYKSEQIPEHMKEPYRTMAQKALLAIISEVFE